MKQRFSSLDIKVIAHELSKSLPSLRVSNIYDLSSRIFLFKFAKPNRREQLILDAGFRCHLTGFSRSTAGTPSSFVSRLRKYLKTRRVTAVTQIGTDRILEIQFSDGQYRLFLEFYASGNVVLTDNELKVLALFRTVNEGAEHEQVRPGSTYNLSERQNINGIPPLTVERVKDGLQKFLERQAANSAQQQKPKKPNKRSEDSLRKGLSNCINEYPPMLLEHALHVIGFDPKIPPEEVVNDDAQVTRVLECLQEAGRVIDRIMQSDTIKGYIIGKPKSGLDKTVAEITDITDGASAATVMYNDFHPFKPKQFEDDAGVSILEFEGYNQTVDEFFSSIEGQKLESRLQEKEEAAKKKLENAKQIQESRIEGLQAVQDENVRKAQAIETNLERVEEATAAVNSLIGQGMDWVEIGRLIELEQEKHNPVAEMIKLPLKLHENTATMLLAEWNADAEEEENDLTDSEPSDSEDDEAAAKSTGKASKGIDQAKDKRLAIDIDLGLSGYSNARDYYDQKKTAAAKEEKTMQASSKALKSAQQKIDADLKRALKQEKQVLQPVRQQFWFEKFIYFISSDGYLVLGARDAQQADLLYKRHTRSSDAYICADISGAASVIVKNNTATPDAPIPPSTLSQAGNLSVATSTAWDSKAVMSAWWVSADQVSKFASTGDFLAPGQFQISGEKNFLPPAQLLLGFAVLFQVSEASKANHTKHRVQTEDNGNGAERSAADADTRNPGYQEISNDHATEFAPKDQSIIAAPADDDSDNSGNGFDADYDGEEAHISDNNGDATQVSEFEAEDGETEDTQQYSNPLQSNSYSGRYETPTDTAPPGLQTPAQQNTDADSKRDLELNGDEADDLDDADEDDDHDDDDDGDDGDDDNATTAVNTANSQIASTTATQSAKQTPVRGKRGKRKKMAQKYAEQDEEDRAAAMALLGSRAGQEKAEEAARAKAAREAEAAAQKERRRAQHAKRQADGRALEERRRQQQPTDAAAEDGEEEGATVDIAALVGTPRPGDEILAAVPVCAPWSALGRCKFKAKLQPGTTKKGKAVREVLGRWTAVDERDGKRVDVRGEDVERVWPRELELLRGWREAEVLNCLPVGKVRVMMAGGLAGATRDAKGSGGGGGNKGRGGRGGKGSKRK